MEQPSYDVVICVEGVYPWEIPEASALDRLDQFLSLLERGVMAEEYWRRVDMIRDDIKNSQLF